MAIPTSQQQEVFSVASYNCLANEFLHYWNGQLNTEQQTYIQQQGARFTHIIQRISKLNSDVICLQELSANQWSSLELQLRQLGYSGEYEQFTGKPDGIATFYKNSKVTKATKQILSYPDHSGRKAMFLHLETRQGAQIDIANTHLQGGNQNKQISNQQIQLLVQKVQQIANNVIVCGDCNFTPMDPRFTEMQKHLVDSLNGQSIPTSMNGTTPLRLDYIWHTSSLSPIRATVDGNLQKFLSPEEPSDHIPVVSTFDIPVLSSISSSSNTSAYATTPAHPTPHYSAPATQSFSLNFRNKFLGSDQNPSFKRMIFNAFNNYMLTLYFSQPTYDDYADRFEKMIDMADLADLNQRGTFLPQLFKEIAIHSEHQFEAKLFCQSFVSILNSTSQSSIYNHQPYHHIPSFRWTLFESFNKLFLNSSLNFEIYNALAPLFSHLITEADQKAKSEKGGFIDHLALLIDSLPSGYAKSLFTEVIQPHKPINTVITIKCKGIPAHQNIFIRGSGCGLTWAKGIPLRRIDQDTWELRVAIPFSGELEYKLLIDDEKWEEGQNHKISQGKEQEIIAAFNPAVGSALQKTLIEVNCVVPPGKTLSVSGNGPLGNWDRKMFLKHTGNNQWVLSFEGQFPGFEYKFRLDDVWEQGNNHRLECGKKDPISSIQF